MILTDFPVIDLSATGKNIRRLRISHGLTVRDLQNYFGFAEPRAIYKWQKGECLPTVDNLYALGILFGVPMDSILVPAAAPPYTCSEQQANACCSVFLFYGKVWKLQFAVEITAVLPVYLPHKLQFHLAFIQASNYTFYSALFFIGDTASETNSSAIPATPITAAVKKPLAKLPVPVITRPTTCEARAAPPQKAPPE